MQQHVADQEDYKFTRAVLAAPQVNIQEAGAAKEAALCEANQSSLDCNAAQEARIVSAQDALLHLIYLVCRRQRQGPVIRIYPAANQGNVGLQDLQNLQRQLDEKTIECESLEDSLNRAMEQTLWADNDAEMWQGAYYQTARAERENAQLLYQNRQLKEEVEQALAAAARAGWRPKAGAGRRMSGSIDNSSNKNGRSMQRELSRSKWRQSRGWKRQRPEPRTALLNVRG
ncbi:hypothetical protein WJX82_001889 [Trebouxia sp. C0006]